MPADSPDSAHVSFPLEDMAGPAESDSEGSALSAPYEEPSVVRSYGADITESESEILIVPYEPESANKTVNPGLERVLSTGSNASDGEVLRRARSAGRRLSWHQRPSLLMLGIAIFMCSFSAGFGLAPIVKLMMDAVCFRVNRDGAGLACDSDVVQRANASIQKYLSLVGIVGTLVSGKLGQMSDMYGRKPLMLYSLMCDLVAAVLTYIFLYPPYFTPWGIVLASVLMNLGGSYLVLMVLYNSYVVDVVDEKDRMNSLGNTIAALSLGGGLGPLCSSFLGRSNWFTLRVALVLRASTIVLIWFFLPESRPERLRNRTRRQSQAQCEPAEEMPITTRMGLKPLIDSIKALRLLWVVRRDAAGRLDLTARINLLLLVAADVIVASVTAGVGGSMVLYAMYQFDWDSNTLALFMGAMMLLNSFVMLVFNPWFHKRLVGVFTEKADTVDRIDTTYVMVATAIRFAGECVAIAATGSKGFMLTGVFFAFAGIGNNAINTALVKYCPSSSQTGEFFGALGLIRNAVSMVAPIAGLTIYSASLGWDPKLIFYIAAMLQALIFGIILLVRVR